MPAHVHGLVADCDNTLWRWKVDLLGFLEHLRSDRRLEPTRTVFCTNWCRPMEAALLAPFGNLRTAGKNCDDLVSQTIVDLVDRKGVDNLTLLGGDHIYADTIAELRRRRPLLVHVVSAQATLSDELRRVADGVTFAERFRPRRIPSSQRRHQEPCPDTERPLFPWARRPHHRLAQGV